MISYIVEILIYQAIFLGLYQFLKSEPYFKINRFYLLGSLVISFLIPLVNFGEILPASVSLPYVEYLQPIQIGEDLNNSFSPVNSNPFQSSNAFEINPFYLIYLIGLGIYLSIFFRQNKGLFKLLRSKKSFDYNSKPVVILPNSNNAFSFWNKIYLGEKITKDQEPFILEHEYQHVKLKHTLDLIFLQCLLFVFWFNPLLFLYRKFLAQVHEFEADQKVLNHSSQTEYINTLLNQKFGTEDILFVNPFFNPSNLKHRIKMITNSKNRKQNLIKYFSVLPVILFCIVISCTQESDIPQLTEEERKEQAMLFLDRLTKEDPNIYEVLKSKPDLKGLLEYYDLELKRKYSSAEKEKVGMLLSLAEVMTKSDEQYRNILLKEIKDNKTIASIYEDISKKIDSIAGIREETQVEALTQDSESSIPYALIDSPPHPENCTGLPLEDLKKCTSQFISEHVNNNFDIKQFSDLEPNRYRISVQFMIDKNGETTDIRARGPSPELEKEAIKAIKSLPKMIPGNVDDKSVNVIYGLPINFVIN